MFIWYCVLQVEKVGAIFKSVSNGISVYQVLLLLGSGAAIIFFSGLPFEKKVHFLTGPKKFLQIGPFTAQFGSITSLC